MSNRNPLTSLGPLGLLDRLIEIVELSDTQRARVESAYKAVAEVLRKADCINRLVRSLDIKAQGSIRAGTTVKPQGQHVFDLDMLCVVELLGAGMDPKRFLDLMWEAMGEHGTYRAMRRRKDRCIRLEYKDEFQLDITPAKPSAPPPLLFVPDRNVAWSSTNPIGFCDDWFLPLTRKMPSIDRLIALNNSQTVTKTDVTVERLPDYGAFDKRPLQRIVQLVKYERDRHYSATDSGRPSSILLTTIIGQAYAELVPGGQTSLKDFVLAVLKRFPDHIQVSEIGGRYHFWVMNPVNRAENFAEKWSLETYSRFLQWHTAVMNRLGAFLKAQPEGLDKGLTLMESSFPEAKTFDLRGRVGKEMRALHDGGGLMVKSAPAILSADVAVPPTIYFGRK